jgi:hypothetical protein
LTEVNDRYRPASGIAGRLFSGSAMSMRIMAKSTQHGSERACKTADDPARGELGVSRIAANDRRAEH